MTEIATADIVRDAEATRDRITTTFDELQHRLSPQTLVSSAIDGALGKASASGLAAVGAAGRLFKMHPVAIAAAGVALGLALFGRRTVNNAHVAMDDYEPYSVFEDGYDANLAFDDPDAAVTEGGPLSDRIDANPLTAVLIGLAGGALIGALFATTETERRVMGQPESAPAARPFRRKRF